MDPMTGIVQNMTTSKLFIGGPPPDGTPHIPFTALEIKVQPYSMELVDEAVLQRRILQAIQLLTGVLGPAAMQMPYLKLKAIADDLFEAMNIKDAANRYIDWGMLQQMVGFNVATQAAQAAGQAVDAMGPSLGMAPGGQGPPQLGSDPGIGSLDDVRERAGILAEASRGL